MRLYTDEKGRQYRIPESWSTYDEEKDMYHIKLEIPGVSKKDMEIALREDKILKITGDRDDYYFIKEFHFPTAVNPDEIKTTFKNGILEIHAKPKVPQVKKIAVM